MIKLTVPSKQIFRDRLQSNIQLCPEACRVILCQSLQPKGKDETGQYIVAIADRNISTQLIRRPPSSTTQLIKRVPKQSTNCDSGCRSNREVPFALQDLGSKHNNMDQGQQVVNPFRKLGSKILSKNSQRFSSRKVVTEHLTPHQFVLHQQAAVMSPTLPKLDETQNHRPSLSYQNCSQKQEQIQKLNHQYQRLLKQFHQLQQHKQLNFNLYNQLLTDLYKKKQQLEQIQRSRSQEISLLKQKLKNISLLDAVQQ